MNLDDIKIVLKNEPLIKELQLNVKRPTRLIVNEHIFNKILCKYEWLKSSTELLYLIKNIDNLENLHIFCKCGNKNSFKNSIIGYLKYCCCKCSNSDIDKKLLIENRNLKKYGKRFVLQVDSVRKKSKMTMNRLYGKDYYVQTKEFKIKSEISCYKHFNARHNWASKDPELNGQAERERKYGKKHFAQSSRYKNLWKDANRTKRIQRKIIDSKRKNGTLNGSKIENKLYETLLTKFFDVIHIYKDEIRYPFNCDFYIPSKDLFIELNFHWTHGKEAFDKNNKQHLKILYKWKSENTKYFNTAIDVWTKRDPNKLKTFQINNLNYKIFYTEKEFNDWFNNI